MEQTVNIERFWRIIKKRKFAIVISALLGLITSMLLIAFVLVPKYESQAQLIVTLPKNETADINDVNSNLQMITTYKDIITGDLIMNEVAKDLEKNFGVHLTIEQLRNLINIKQKENSQMFSIVATDPDPKLAQYIANTTAEKFQKNAKQLLNVDRISIISKATLSKKPTEPHKKMVLAKGLVTGLFIGLMFVLILEFMDRTISDSDTIRNEFNTVVLGSIPYIDEKDIKQKRKKK
ncbi:YveK family protein [Enterococcus ratti]|uniref:Capsular polysaccharide biosynthesis protein CpsC n=1 Tax=Enterococcus ratti TaxID=150033 RepID=A0A1L8WKU4_9ENTE|nr:Wzz/FepE/Etk N-terminal domain-containing protein [Enterococcus ratti]OJG81651.1 tyrosine-protein kinase transmembrane modulator EpsC [Enterococcus ratti]